MKHSNKLNEKWKLQQQKKAMEEPVVFPTSTFLSFFFRFSFTCGPERKLPSQLTTVGKVFYVPVQVGTKSGFFSFYDFLTKSFHPSIVFKNINLSLKCIIVKIISVGFKNSFSNNYFLVTFKNNLPGHFYLLKVVSKSYKKSTQPRTLKTLFKKVHVISDEIVAQPKQWKSMLFK